MSDVQVERNGTFVTMSVVGWIDKPTRAWLCPADPGPGEIWGNAGATRLNAAGCFDLGMTAPPPGETRWSLTIDERGIPRDKVAGFAPVASYRLLLVASVGGNLRSHLSALPPMSLAP
jgi:hypothetical protein